jgi:hypothetical protein
MGNSSVILRDYRGNEHGDFTSSGLGRVIEINMRSRGDRGELEIKTDLAYSLSIYLDKSDEYNLLWKLVGRRQGDLERERKLREKRKLRGFIDKFPVPS